MKENEINKNIEEENPIESEKARKKVKEIANGILVGTTGFVCAVLVYKLLGQKTDLTKSLTTFATNEKTLKTTASNLIEGSEKAIKSTEPILSEVVKETASSLTKSKPFYRSQHIRNLPNGWKPSEEKVALAKELGIMLDNRQTFVIGTIVNKDNAA